MRVRARVRVGVRVRTGVGVRTRVTVIRWPGLKTCSAVGTARQARRAKVRVRVIGLELGQRDTRRSTGLGLAVGQRIKAGAQG